MGRKLVKLEICYNSNWELNSTRNIFLQENNIVKNGLRERGMCEGQVQLCLFWFLSLWPRRVNGTSFYSKISIQFYSIIEIGWKTHSKPWNFYITPENYWNHKLSTNFSQNGTIGVEQNWMQNFWQNFLSILCTGIVFVMSILMQFRPKSWTKECMITGFIQ